MSFLRAIGLAAGILGGGVALARNRIDREIERKIDARIAEARDEAVLALEDEVARVVSTALSRFVRNLILKASAVLLIVAGRLAGLYSAEIMHWMILACVAVFMMIDIFNSWPHVMTAIREIRKAGWNMLDALRAFVSASAFDRAYERVVEETSDPKVKYWIAASRYSQDDISKRIAEAVSDVAARSSVKIVRVRALSAALRGSVWMAAYSAMISWVLFNLR